MIVRGHWFHVYGLGNEFATVEGDVPTKISLGLNKVSGCHTKPMRQLFCWLDNALCQQMPPFASAIVACRHELERLLRGTPCS